jgi:hypothetical protein
VDKAHHPIHQLLKQDKHRFSNLLAANVDKVPTFMKAPDEAEYHIQHFMADPHSRVMWFYSNMTHEHAYGMETSAELQDFIRYTLRPRDEFAAYINAHIPKHPYSILHYRLGDTELVRSDTSATPCDRVFIHFLQRYSESDIVLSDSETFKQYIRTYYPAARMFDTTVCHIGHEESYTALRDTLFELFALMGATHIRSYTVYGWPSGFINAIHKVFSIPATFQTHFDA